MVCQPFPQLSSEEPSFLQAGFSKENMVCWLSSLLKLINQWWKGRCSLRCYVVIIFWLAWLSRWLWGPITIMWPKWASPAIWWGSWLLLHTYFKEPNKRTYANHNFLNPLRNDLNPFEMISNDLKRHQITSNINIFFSKLGIIHVRLFGAVD